MTFLIVAAILILVLILIGYWNSENGYFICMVNRYSKIGRIELKLPDGSLRWIKFKEGQDLPPIGKLVAVKIYFNRYKGYSVLDANKNLFFD